MKTVVASDLHGSPLSLSVLLEKVRRERPSRVILLGDLLYHGPRNPLPAGYGPAGMPDAFLELMDICPLTAVRGNCDAEIDLVVLPFPMPESAWVLEDGLEIFASHGHRIPEEPPMPGFAKGTVFLRGHTHVPRAEAAGGFAFWNPGSMTLPKGGWPRTWATIDDGVFTVLTLDDEVVMRHSARDLR